MAVNYSISLRKNPKDAEAVPKAYATAQTLGTYSLNALAKRIAAQSTVSRADVNAVISSFAALYDPADDNQAWFAKVKEVAAQNGFAAEMSDYKADPSKYKGSVADVAEILRIAITGMSNSPDLCTIMGILGRDRCLARMNAAMLN